MLKLLDQRLGEVLHVYRYSIWGAEAGRSQVGGLQSKAHFEKQYKKDKLVEENRVFFIPGYR